MTKPLLLFDMDGTLIVLSEKPKYISTLTNHGSYISIKHQMKEIVVRYGIPAELVKELNRMALIWNFTYCYLEKIGTPDEHIQKVIEEINVPFMVEERADHAVSVLLEGTLTGLEVLKIKGYDMGLVTTASRDSYDWFSNHSDFGCFGKYFRYSVTRDDCRYIKPEPEPIHRILKLFKRDRFVYIGDSDHDAEACQAAGGRFILINTREYDADTIRSLKPDAVIESLVELPTVLETLKIDE
jgi:phosphoglycolate phosphatase-like HAD superfamily hydrolase